MKIAPHIIFNGNCAEALEFYQQVLGAKVLMKLHYGEMPKTGMSEECGAAMQGMEDKIMHSRITVGDFVIMACDVPPARYGKPGGFDLNISVTTPEEAEKLFAALTEKGEVEMPMSETFWAQRFGMGVDRFGIPWMVNCEKVCEKNQS